MTIARTIVGGFAVSLLILLMIGLVSLGSTGRLLISTSAVERAQSLQTSLESLLQAVVDSETGSRGYALTGNTEYLDPYNRAPGQIDVELWNVRQMLDNDPAQLERVDRLNRLIDERLLEAARVISARDDGGLEGAATLIVSGRGKKLTDEIRAVIEETRNIESAELATIQSRARDAARFTRAVIVFGTLIAVCVVAFFGALTYQQMRERARTQADRDMHFNASLDMLCVAGFDGFFKQLNPAWSATLGWSVEDLTSRPWLEFVHPDDMESTVAAGAHITSGKPLPAFENRYRCKDGTYKWISWNCVPMVENELIYGVARDVTEQRRSRKQFRSLFEGSPNGLLLVDESRAIVLVNGAITQMFGYNAEELVGQPVEILVPDRFRDRHPGDVARYWTQPTRRAMGAVDNLFGQRKDGSEFPLHVGLTPIESEHGLQVLAGVVDLTERKKAEDRVRLLNVTLTEKSQELEAANRELESFSYSVSHDLRAPLRAIDGFSRVLLDKYADPLPADARRYLQNVRANTVRMGQLIDDLLAFSRLSRQPVNRRPLTPSSQVRDVFHELRADCNGRDIEFRVGELPEFDGDPALMRIVWENLLSNALKYTRNKERAEIEVGCKSNGNGTAIYFVKDNGAGFDMQYADKLFGVFQRLHRAEDYEGTGVGLATVQRIIHRHGGHIWAESEVDKGTTFSFTVEGTHDHEREARRNTAR